MTGKKYFLLKWNILIFTTIYKLIFAEYSNIENSNEICLEIENFSNSNDNKKNNYRTLESNQINPNSATICPLIKDCFNCITYGENFVNCKWSENGCVVSFSLNQSFKWWTDFHTCQIDIDSLSKMKKYCGNQENDFMTFSPLNFTLPQVNQEYGFPNLYCRWSFHNEEPLRAISFYFLNKYKKISRFIFSLEITYLDGRVLYHTVEQDKYIWDSQGIVQITIYFYTEKSYPDKPFIFEMDYNSLSSPANIGLFVSIGVLIIAIISCSICVYKCKRIIVRNANIRNNERRTQIQTSRANIQQDDSEENIKSKNKILLEKLFDSELKSQKYTDSLNEFKSSCTICIESFNEESLVAVLFCKHIFHFECLKDWVNKNLIHPKCPNCNFNLIEFANSNETKLEVKIDILSDSNITGNNENRTNIQILQNQRVNVRLTNRSDRNDRNDLQADRV